MSEVSKVIIIGSGPAGLTAALYAARADLAPVVFMGQEPGGQLMTTTEVENFPGFPEGIQGPELMELFKKQAARFGAQLLSETVTRVDFSGAGSTTSRAENSVSGDHVSAGTGALKPHKVYTGLGVEEKEYQARAVIIGTGASTQWLGIESETRLRGHGVSSCATCDGAFFRGKRVVVVGGGDTAMEEALFLTKFATEVAVVHRRAELRASKIMQERAQKNPKIRFVWNAEVAEVLGDVKVTGARLRDTQNGTLSELACDGIFVAIGHKPNTDVFKKFLPVDVKGYLHPAEHTHSPLPGIFIAGDVSDIRYRQAVTAAGEGCKAAMDVEKWLEES